MVKLVGLVGDCGARRVFLGTAPARLLYSLSFPAVLNEDTGDGYQRRFSEKHSRDFRRYITQAGSTTIPLTLNLRPELSDSWQLHESPTGIATLTIPTESSRVFAQVDCQHRLGSLSDVDIPLAYMSYIGLDLRSEMQIFNVINAKAKGLSSSLIDYHDTQLVHDLAQQKPQLYIAAKLNREEASPWYRQLDLGGDHTVGMARKASLRTMQKATAKFLNTSHILESLSPEEAYEVVLSFWQQIPVLLDPEWKAPRKHFLTKGIGVYALMHLAGHLVREHMHKGRRNFDGPYFQKELAPFICGFDWSNNGPLKGLGGESGATAAFHMLLSRCTQPITCE